MKRQYIPFPLTATMQEQGIEGMSIFTFIAKNAIHYFSTGSWNTEGYAISTACSFTGKERDSETGYGYFGARYMDHELMTGWLSVDPMSDKYLGISPYAYCAWNPVKLVDPDGEEMVESGDGWKIDKQNKTITRVSLDGGNSTQFVEGDGRWIRSECRGDLLNEYNDYTIIDNIQSETHLNPAKEKIASDAVSFETAVGSIAGGTGVGCKKMSNEIFDMDNGTYMGKDGSIKIMQKGKNGGLNGRYQSQIKTSAKYIKAGRICSAVGIATAIISIDNTEKQFRNSNISQRERWTNHAIDVIGLTPIGCFAPLAYELGKKYGPSTWFK